MSAGGRRGRSRRGSERDSVAQALERAWSVPLAELDELPGLRDTTQRSVVLVRGTP